MTKDEEKLDADNDVSSDMNKYSVYIKNKYICIAVGVVDRGCVK